MSERQPAENDALPEIVTKLTTAQLNELLAEANRRGRMSEVVWDGDGQFMISVASRPIVTYLRGHVEDTGQERHLRFDVRLDRKSFWITLLVTIAFIIVGPVSTEYFIRLYSWWWQPPLYALSAVWIWWSWPTKSLKDGKPLVQKLITFLKERIASAEQVKVTNAA